MAELTYSRTDGHEHVTDDLGVVHHDGLHRAVQHADLQRPLLLLVLQSVLTDRRDNVRSSGLLDSKTPDVLSKTLWNSEP